MLEGVGGELANGKAAFAAAPLDRAIWPGGGGCVPPITVVGLASIDLLARAIDERPGLLQYLPRVLVVEPRAEVALAALARYAEAVGEPAARALLDAPGVEWFIGPDAMPSFETWLAERADDLIPNETFLTGISAELGEAVSRLLGEAHARQQALMREHTGTLRQRANDRQRREAVRTRWRRGDGLRLLVSTSRFSTYMRHSAADLVGVLHELGHEARLLTEPDDHTRMTQLHYLRAMLEFEPDGVVLLNYLRPQIGPVLPPYVPVMTWSQDAMGHFFAGAQPPKASWNDFVVGLLYPELRDRLGVPEQRMLSWNNPVSGVKFHRRSADASHENLRCDVAMMTRHSESPETYVQRKMRESANQTGVQGAIAAFKEFVTGALERAGREDRWLAWELRESCVRALQEGFGRPPTASMVEGFLQQLALPLADLYYRQDVAQWAASVCERRGWRLHLYGAGWDDHPKLAAHARGELTHGDDLRTAYQLAGVTIHASVRGQNHQRVAEAAMSGGLPIVRRCFEDLDRARWYQLNEIVGHREPDGTTDDGRPEFAIANHPELMRVASLWSRCGKVLGQEGMVSLTTREMGILRSCPLGKPKLPHEDPAWPLIDVGEVGFSSEAELEQLVERSMRKPWRTAWSAAIEARARQRFSMEHFAERMIELVRTNLS